MKAGWQLRDDGKLANANLLGVYLEELIVT